MPVESASGQNSQISPANVRRHVVKPQSWVTFRCSCEQIGFFFHILSIEAPGVSAKVAPSPVFVSNTAGGQVWRSHKKKKKPFQSTSGKFSQIFGDRLLKKDACMRAFTQFFLFTQKISQMKPPNK